MTSLQQSLEVYLQSRALILSEEDSYRNILIAKLLSVDGLTVVVLDPQRKYAAGKANVICFDGSFALLWQAEPPPACGNLLRAYRDVTVGVDGELDADDCAGAPHRLGIRDGRLIGERPGAG